MNHSVQTQSAVLACVVAAVLSGYSGAALADTTVSVSPFGTLTSANSWYDTGAGQNTPSTVTGNPNSTSGGVLVNDLSANPSSTYSFGNNFSAPNGSFADITINDANQGPEGIGFIDSYVFNVPASVSNASVISLNLGSVLGLSDLTMRLYEYSAGGNQNLVVGTTSPVMTGWTDNWSQSNNASGGGYVASSTLAPTGLLAGEYVLEIAGLEVGSQSGSYTGQLNITPVPLPAAFPLLFGGLAMIGAAVRRRRD